MSYYSEPDSHVRDKVEVLLDLSKYAIKKELEHDIGVDTSDLVAKKDFVTFESEVGKLGINQLIKVPTNLINLETKVGDLNVGRVKSVPADLKKLSDVVYKQGVKKTVYCKSKQSRRNIPDASAVIQASQYNIDKQSLKKKTGDVENKIPDVTGLMNITTFNTKIGKVENKLPNVSGLATRTILYTKTGKGENKISDASGL